MRTPNEQYTYEVAIRGLDRKTALQQMEPMFQKAELEHLRECSGINECGYDYYCATHETVIDKHYDNLTEGK